LSKKAFQNGHLEVTFDELIGPVRCHYCYDASAKYERSEE
jgi:hypothetical protein